MHIDKICRWKLTWKYLSLSVLLSLSQRSPLCVWEKKIITCPSSTSQSTDLGIESREWEWICFCNWTANLLQMCCTVYIPIHFKVLMAKIHWTCFWEWTFPDAFKHFSLTDANSLCFLCTGHPLFSSSLCVLPFLLYVLSPPPPYYSALVGEEGSGMEAC